MKKAFFLVVSICLCGLIGCVLAGCKQDVIEINYHSKSREAIDTLNNNNKNSNAAAKVNNGVIFLGNTQKTDTASIDFEPAALKFSPMAK